MESQWCFKWTLESLSVKFVKLYCRWWARSLMKTKSPKLTKMPFCKNQCFLCPAIHRDSWNWRITWTCISPSNQTKKNSLKKLFKNTCREQSNTSNWWKKTKSIKNWSSSIPAWWCNFFKKSLKFRVVWLMKIYKNKWRMIWMKKLWIYI